VELKVPLQVALTWLGTDYSPEYNVYQVEVAGNILHIQIFRDRGYATVVSTYNFSLKLIEELRDYFHVVAKY